MTQSRQRLIQHLVADLPRQRSSYASRIWAAAWWTGAWLLVLGVALWSAPMRPGIGGQLASSAQFGLEMVLGLISCALLTVVAFDESTPHPSRIWLRVLAIGITALWVLTIALGLYLPALPPSMLGKRDHCVWEVILYGLPVLVGGLALMQRGFVLNAPRAGLLLGLAAGVMPGLLMQAACMYIPEHGLTHHVAPIVIVALTGWAIGAWIAFRGRTRSHS